MQKYLWTYSKILWGTHYSIGLFLSKDHMIGYSELQPDVAAIMVAVAKEQLVRSIFNPTEMESGT